MKKILGLVFIAVFACSAFVAVASASAEETLLAEWLFNGAKVETLLSTTSEGEILLSDEGFGSVTCSGIFIGSVGPNGEDETTEVQSLAKVAGTLTTPIVCKNDSGSLCETNTTDITASPEKLPWHTELLLMENGKFLDMVAEAAYSVTCLVLGFTTTDECTVLNGEFEVLNVSGGVEATGEVLPKGNCTVGGAEKAGEIFLAPNVTKDLETGTLSVSSE